MLSALTVMSYEVQTAFMLVFSCAAAGGPTAGSSLPPPFTPCDEGAVEICGGFSPVNGMYTPFGTYDNRFWYKKLHIERDHAALWLFHDTSKGCASQRFACEFVVRVFPCAKLLVQVPVVADHNRSFTLTHSTVSAFIYGVQLDFKHTLSQITQYKWRPALIQTPVAIN